MKHLSRLTILLSFSLALTMGCTSSDNLSTKGQLIECQVAADGTVSGCEPVDEPSGAPGTCVDHDEDGDDDPHDAEAEDDDADDANLTGDSDDDDDGIGDAEDDDDDNDGIEDADDCDEHPGEDNDDEGETDET